jgi:hypothetical protein
MDLEGDDQVTEGQKQQRLSEIRDAQRRLDSRVSEKVKKTVSSVADQYDSDLRKLARS